MPRKTAPGTDFASIAARDKQARELMEREPHLGFCEAWHRILGPQNMETGRARTPQFRGEQASEGSDVFRMYAVTD